MVAGKQLGHLGCGRRLLLLLLRHVRERLRRTLADIRAFTSVPVSIGETAVGPGPAAVSQVTGLLEGVKADHFAGLVWFDKAQHAPPYHQDWHLADHPPALAAFRAE